MRRDFIAVLTRPLSASKVQKAKPANKDYELFDGQGLLLFVRTTGKKSGAFATNIPVRLPLRYDPAMSLVSAGTRHTEHLTLPVQGIDPKKGNRKTLKENGWRWIVCLPTWQ